MIGSPFKIMSAAALAIAATVSPALAQKADNYTVDLGALNDSG